MSFEQFTKELHQSEHLFKRSAAYWMVLSSYDADYMRTNTAILHGELASPKERTDGMIWREKKSVAKSMNGNLISLNGLSPFLHCASVHDLNVFCICKDSLVRLKPIVIDWLKRRTSFTLWSQHLYALKLEMVCSSENGKVARFYLFRTFRFVTLSKIFRWVYSCYALV